LLLIITFVNVLDRPDSQQLRERLGVIVIGLVAILDELVVARIADHDRGHQRLDQFMQPGGMCALFKDMAERIQDYDYSDYLMDIHAHILNITHRTPPCC
jgi:hypothetical protein